MVRADIALKGQTIEAKEFYIATSEELFVGLGKNTKQGQIFDQNRAYVGIGYKFPFDTRIEVGYFSQINPKEGKVDGVNANGATIVRSNVDANNALSVILFIDNIGTLFKKKVETPKL